MVIATLDAPTVVRFASAGSETAFVRELLGHTAWPGNDLVVDLGDAPMVSSTVLTALRRAAVTLRENGGRLVVVSSHATLRRLLDLTLLGRSFGVADTLEQALERGT